MPLTIKVTECDGDLSEFLRRYEYQPKLTTRLDDLEDVDLTPELLYPTVQTLFFVE
jgi:hypothetical protein